MDIKLFLSTIRYRLRFHAYGFEIMSFSLPRDGHVEYAQWLHPFEGMKEITQSEIDELRNYLSEGDIAIDIGAHTGDTTIPIAIAAGKSGLTLALEPNRYVFPILEKNSKLNKEKTNIVPLMLAASEDDGETFFYYSDASFCNGGRYEGISIWKQSKIFKQKVKVVNLERFLQREYSDIIGRIKYIKIDTEGHDLMVIRSISKLISEHKPYVKAEVFIYTSYEQRVELYRLFKDMGYTIYKVASDYNYKGEIIEEKTLMQWKHYDIFCVPRRSD